MAETPAKAPRDPTRPRLVPGAPAAIQPEEPKSD